MTCAKCGRTHDELTSKRLGQYELQALLGSGGMASVYEARRAGPARNRVAVKVLHACYAGDPAMKARLFNEAEASGRIFDDHDPNQYYVGRVLEGPCEDEGMHYLVMEHLRGKNLKKFLAEQPEHKLPLKRAVDFVLDAACGLHAAHEKRIVHRDVKPANLFVVLGSPNEPEHCKILDFGISKFLDGDGRDPVTRAGDAPGTEGYMAPEQFEGRADARTDVWLLGAVLYELSCGEPLLDTASTESSSQIPPVEWERFAQQAGAGRGLLGVIQKATLVDPSARYRNVPELYHALKPFGERHRVQDLLSATSAPTGTAPTAEARQGRSRLPSGAPESHPTYPAHALSSPPPAISMRARALGLAALATVSLSVFAISRPRTEVGVTGAPLLATQAARPASSPLPDAPPPAPPVAANSIAIPPAQPSAPLRSRSPDPARSRVAGNVPQKPKLNEPTPPAMPSATAPRSRGLRDPRL